MGASRRRERWCTIG
uniref:Uncharacterized protein n=1 Tax=Rhizophora mucronata TaxID=61149 RepID=A0A2P2QZP2_RHIMU